MYTICMQASTIGGNVRVSYMQFSKHWWECQSFIVGVFRVSCQDYQGCIFIVSYVYPSDMPYYIGMNIEYMHVFCRDAYTPLCFLRTYANVVSRRSTPKFLFLSQRHFYGNQRCCFYHSFSLLPNWVRLGPHHSPQAQLQHRQGYQQRIVFLELL